MRMGRPSDGVCVCVCVVAGAVESRSGRCEVRLPNVPSRAMAEHLQRQPAAKTGKGTPLLLQLLQLLLPLLLLQQLLLLTQM